MDKFWSVCAMPIGLFLCFTPILIAWVIEGTKGQQGQPQPQRADREKARH